MTAHSRFRRYLRNAAGTNSMLQATNPASQATIRVVSHNAFWFQGVPFKGEVPPDPEPDIFSRLVEVYRELKADVLCLQEVQSEGVAAEVAARLNMAYTYTAGDGFPQYGGAVLSHYPFEALQPSGRPQLDRLLLQVVVNTPGGVLRLSNVHLPSNRFRGADGGAQQRLTEIPLAIEAAGHPVDVVLGDLNEAAGGPCGQWLSAQSYCESAPLCDAADEPSSIGGMRGDQIWIRRALVPRLHAYIVVPKQTFTAETTHKSFLSDHLPVGIEIRTM